MYFLTTSSIYSDHYRILLIPVGHGWWFQLIIISSFLYSHHCFSSPLIVTTISTINRSCRVSTHMSSFLYSHHCFSSPLIVTTISTISRSCRVSTHNHVFIFRDLNRSVLLKCVSLDCCYHVSKAEPSLTSQQHAVVLRAIYEMVVNYS